MNVVSYVALGVIGVSLLLPALRKFPAAGSIAVANLVVFGLTVFGPESVRILGGRGETLSAIHADLALDSQTLAQAHPLAFLQLLSSMFVHADLWHILGNVIVLLAFALPFEERVGSRRFLAIYLLSGLVGALVQVSTAWGEPILLMGASAAVFGIIGAFGASYPNDVVPLPLPLLFIMLFVRMRVWVAAAVFAVLQLVMAAANDPTDPTAYAAHLGGLAAGVVLGATVARRTRAKRAERVRIDYAALSAFAQDAGTRTALEHIRSNRDEPAVLQAWVERFFRTAACPTCQHPVMPGRGGQVVCTRGHSFDVRQAA